MELSNAAASRHLASLEDRVFSRLVQRNTRRMFLTETGEAFYRRCKTLLIEMKEAEAAASESVVQPTGLLRVTSSLSFSMLHITPLLPAFYEKYPQLRVEIVAANRYYDLIENGIDVAVRTRELENDSNITVRRIAQTRRLLAASPQYLQRRGTPHALEDLSQHHLLTYTYSNQPNQLLFTKGEQVRSVSVQPLLAANDGQVLRAAALSHVGILVQPRYIIHDDIVAGRLVPVLTEWDLPRLTINLAYQSRQHLPAKVRCFIDFLVQHFERMDYDRKWTA
jgi:DNA-binding transcriptional LysR family regulator